MRDTFALPLRINLPPCQWTFADPLPRRHYRHDLYSPKPAPLIAGSQTHLFNRPERAQNSLSPCPVPQSKVYKALG